MAKHSLIIPPGLTVLVTRTKNGFRLRPVLGPHETGGTKLPPRPLRPQPAAGPGREQS